MRRAAFPILRFGTDSTAVIDVVPVIAQFQHDMITGTPSVSAAFKANGAKLRSGIATLLRSSSPGSVQPVTPVADGWLQVANVEGSTHVIQRWSILQLPKTPMQGRLADPRLTFLQAGNFVERWRLEKRDPTAAVSDVVRPIVYWLDTQNIPHQWLPWFRRGIEEWSSVFDSLGFRHAIVIKEQEYEPRYDDTTHGVWITWIIGRAEGAAEEVPPAVDPRSGEILHGEQHYERELFASMERTYFVGTGGQPAGLRFPFPDSLTGSIIQGAVAHEVGHSLGFDHNFRAGAVYPTDSLRSADFIRRYGHTGSVMSYAWLNYVAQPEDHIPPTALPWCVGPYDRWALHYGYAPIPGAKTPEEEQPTLERWRAVQDTTPYLRVAVPVGTDPNDQQRAVGTDPVKSAGYALRNLARAVPKVDSQVTADSVLRDAVHKTFTDFWQAWLTPAGDVVGGITVTGPIPRDRSATPFAPIDSAHQVEAFRFLLTHLFRAQDPVLRALVGSTLPDTAIVLFENVRPGWSAKEWQMAQLAMFNTLISNARLQRVASQSKTTHVLPVVCAELTTLNDALTKVQATTTSVDMRNHVDQLLQSLTSIVDPLFGMCSPADSPTGAAQATP